MHYDHCRRKSSQMQYTIERTSDTSRILVLLQRSAMELALGAWSTLPRILQSDRYDRPKKTIVILPENIIALHSYKAIRRDRYLCQARSDSSQPLII